MHVKTLASTEQTVQFAVTETDYTMHLKLERQTSDLLIQIIGGDVPHYGVITTVDKTGKALTTALPSRPGHVHQEKVLIDQVLKTVKPLIMNNAVLVSGMHVNEITPAQMRAAMPMAHELGVALAKWLKAHPDQTQVVTYAK
ncbi:conserved protein of unknown function [Latilactobacillus sakei]|uniref:prenylated flavin chaperone LpdD n=1 Tax=Latilactobacillus sakei TaxID=1599 RepID=UPI000C6F07C4|nr:hypothetical protein [Latilactobacillus sakei]SON66746.1 conserved protein of unknown function [Latilactobacillus sakei]